MPPIIRITTQLKMNVHLLVKSLLVVKVKRIRANVRPNVIATASITISREEPAQIELTRNDSFRVNIPNKM